MATDCGVLEHVTRTHRGLITEVEFRTQREGGGTRTNGMEFVRDWDDIPIAPDPNDPWDGGGVMAVDVSYFKIIPGGGAPLVTQIMMRALIPLPQNPFPTYTEADEKNIPKEAPDPDCDDELAAIFGGKGAKASGSGYHPDGMMIGPNPALGWNPHLFRTMHLFGNNTGTAAGQVYAPAGGGIPFSREKVAPGQGSLGIDYAQLGAVSNVTLVISHVKNYTNPGAITNRTLIGNIGGPKGDSGGKQPYIHSHLAILDSEGRNISFKDAYCR